MSIKITSPLKGFDGRTVFGPIAVEFKNGVAETDQKITPGLRSYLKARGYKVGKGTETTESGSTDEAKAAAEKEAAAKAVADKEAAEKEAAEKAAAESSKATEQKGGQKNG